MEQEFKDSTFIFSPRFLSAGLLETPTEEEQVEVEETKVEETETEKKEEEESLVVELSKVIDQIRKENEGLDMVIIVEGDYIKIVSKELNSHGTPLLSIIINGDGSIEYQHSKVISNKYGKVDPTDDEVQEEIAEEKTEEEVVVSEGETVSEKETEEGVVVDVTEEKELSKEELKKQK